MRMNIKLDERQLYLRGNAFKHGFILMGLLLLFDAFFKSEGITLVEGMWGNILIVLLAAAICEIELIIKGALDFEDRSNTIPLLIIGILGFVLLIWDIIELFVYDYRLFIDNTLSKHGAMLLINITWIAVAIIFIIKKRSLDYTDE